jgi:Lar family restriction alleviation protein
MNAKLKECPFCGSTQYEIAIKDCYNDEGAAAHQIVCAECDARGPAIVECLEYRDSIEEAQKLWNRRWKGV